MITVKHPTKKHLRLAIAYALFAGAIAAPFAASPAYALPVEGANAAANAAEATITTTTLSGGDIMYITGKTSFGGRISPSTQARRCALMAAPRRRTI